jgi:predicted metalloendopeptidase
MTSPLLRTFFLVFGHSYFIQQILMLLAFVLLFHCRWKRALEALEDALGDALGQLYVSKYFSGDAKPRALRVVSNNNTTLVAGVSQ